MDIGLAYAHVVASLNMDVGRFYQPGDSLTLGKGKIYRSVIFPLFDVEHTTFLTVRGIGLVLTHECDVDADNDRMFSDDALVCPIIPLENLVVELTAEISESQLVSFLTNLGARNISRLAYLPPSSPDLPYGGVLFLNQITNTHVSVFSTVGASAICALSGFGLWEIEYLLENHLLRPKADRAAFVPAYL